MAHIFKNKNGFTIIEAIVVVCIIGILAGVTGTGMIHYLPDYHLNKDVLDVQSMIQNARLRAVKSNADVFLQFDTANHTCQARLDNTDDPVNRGFLDAGDVAIANLKMSSGVEFTNLLNITAAMKINSRGFSNQAGQIHMKNNGDRYKGVNVTLSGNSRVIRSSDGGATWE